jgi:hypothetical protein
MRRGLMLLCATSMAAFPVYAAAQNTGPSRSDSLVFEREVFEYPNYDRRNPFAPLLSSAEGGPRFERLRLLGIVYSEDPRLSLVTLTDGDEEGERRPSYRVRVGDRIGNSTVLEILPRSVVLEVDDFGLTERRVLKIRSRTQGQGGP